MTKRASPGDFESDQENWMTHATPVTGGAMPDAKAVIKSANARSKKRHEVGGDNFADVNVLPESSGPVLDKAGIKDNGYIAKKGTPFGVEAFFNSLPPGMDITDQEVSDIREQPLVEYKGGITYPGDGWT